MIKILGICLILQSVLAYQRASAYKTTVKIWTALKMMAISEPSRDERELNDDDDAAAAD